MAALPNTLEAVFSSNNYQAAKTKNARDSLTDAGIS
jgi:hypothetical protein